MSRIVVPLALLLFLPLFGLALPFLLPEFSGNADSASNTLVTSTLAHLWHFVLGDYLVATLALIFGVGIGVFFGGAPHLAPRSPFSGSELWEFKGAGGRLGTLPPGWCFLVKLR